MKKILLFLLMTVAVFSAQLKDGKYSVTENVMMGKKWKSVVEMEVKGGEINKLTYDMVDKKGNLLSKSDELSKVIEEADGVDPYIEIPKHYLEKREKTEHHMEVDAIAGASECTSKFNTMMGFLIEKAQDGETGDFKMWCH